jgi:betaine lipid synthase
MDHMDWFNENALPCPLDDEIGHMHRVLAPGGAVFWRSAARRPWYVGLFEKRGFAVTALAVREPGTRTPIDRVNMYASFYRADKA